MNPTQVLPVHHKHCDELFAARSWPHRKAGGSNAARRTRRFAGKCPRTSLPKKTFSFQRSKPYPALQAATQMMRMEHGQMNTLMSAGEQAVDAADANGFFGALDTLLIMMQQHNMKEENILYPMCDRALASRELDLGRELAKRASGS